MIRLDQVKYQEEMHATLEFNLISNLQPQRNPSVEQLEIGVNHSVGNKWVKTKEEDKELDRSMYRGIITLFILSSGGGHGGGSVEEGTMEVGEIGGTENKRC